MLSFVLALATVSLLASASGALALSGSPIHVGEPGSNAKPSVAVDASGTAYVAWANEEGVGPEKVEYCVILSGASACSQSGSLVPGKVGHPPAIDQVQVLVDGASVIILAEVFGGEEAYDPVEEWVSTNSGATFTPVNGLKSVDDGSLSADSGAINAVVMPGENALGYAWTSVGAPEPPGDAPTFDEFPLTSPPTCSGESCPVEEHYAALQPPGSPDFLSNEPGAVASQQGANAGVLGVFETDGAPGPTSCTFSTVYYYGSGPQAAKTNSYDISPGTAGSAWKVGLHEGDCNVNGIAVGGGPSGFGVVENDEETRSIVYHPFDPTNEDFDTPFYTVDPEEEGGQKSVSQDGSGGIYVTYLDGGVGTRLAYSDTGGETWVGPATITYDTEEGNLSSAVGSDGQGWATWTQNGSVYVQPFDATDAVPPVVTPPPLPPTPLPTKIDTSQSGGGISGPYLTEPQGAAVTDQAYLTGTNAKGATGTVTYNVYSNSRCTVAAAAGSVANVVNGVPGPSAAVKLKPGTYYWRASYSGDSLNVGSTTACGAEVLVVAVSATTLGLPSGKMCLSKRHFLVHPRAPKGVKLVSVEVQINGRRVSKGKLSNHATNVSLVGLPKGTFKVALITKSSKGQTYEEVRTFHTCVPKKRKRHH